MNLPHANINIKTNINVTEVVIGIFKPASKREIRRRRKEYIEKIYPEIIAEWAMKFAKRTDITRNPDGSFDVNGDVLSLPPNSLSSFPIKLNKVNGSVICFELESLNNFPKEVNGNVILINCKVDEGAIRKCCDGFYVVFVGNAQSYGI